MLTPDINTEARRAAEAAFPVNTPVRNRHQAGMPGVVIGHLSTGQVVVEIGKKAVQVKAEHLEGLS